MLVFDLFIPCSRARRRPRPKGGGAAGAGAPGFEAQGGDGPGWRGGPSGPCSRDGPGRDAQDRGSRLWRPAPQEGPHREADAALHARGPASPEGPEGRGARAHDRRLCPRGDPAPEDGGRPLHWLLLTTESAADIETARTVLRRYELRWRIARFFHALEVGTRIGDRRLDQADDLKKCLAFDMITAFRVRDLSLPAREDVTARRALAARHGFRGGRG